MGIAREHHYRDTILHSQISQRLPRHGRHLLHVFAHAAAHIKQEQQRQLLLLVTEIDDRLRLAVFTNNKVLGGKIRDHLAVLHHLRIHSYIRNAGLECDVRGFLRERWAY